MLIKSTITEIPFIGCNTFIIHGNLLKKVSTHMFSGSTNIISTSVLHFNDSHSTNYINYAN